MSQGRKAKRPHWCSRVAAWVLHRGLVSKRQSGLTKPQQPPSMAPNVVANCYSPRSPHSHFLTLLPTCQHPSWSLLGSAAAKESVYVICTRAVWAP